MRYLWISCGWICVAAGAAGAVLPFVPTTPFLLLAALCFSKGSQRLHLWLTTHPRFGPPIAHWRDHRAIARKAKILAIVAMVAIFGLSVAMRIPMTALIAQGLVLACVAAFILTRPVPPDD